MSSKPLAQTPKFIILEEQKACKEGLPCLSI
jgi:hypothetical protein